MVSCTVITSSTRLLMTGCVWSMMQFILPSIRTASTQENGQPQANNSRFLMSSNHCSQKSLSSSRICARQRPSRQHYICGTIIPTPKKPSSTPRQERKPPSKLVINPSLLGVLVSSVPLNRDAAAKSCCERARIKTAMSSMLRPPAQRATNGWNPRL